MYLYKGEEEGKKNKGFLSLYPVSQSGRGRSTVLVRRELMNGE